MRKKQLLATLVMLSLLQGSAYAAVDNDGYLLKRQKDMQFTDNENIFRNVNDDAVTMEAYSSLVVGKEGAINKFESGTQYTYDENGNINGVSGDKGNAISASFIKKLEIIGKETSFYGNIDIQSLSGPFIIKSDKITVDGDVDIIRTNYTDRYPEMSISGDTMLVTGDFALRTWTPRDNYEGKFDQYTMNLNNYLNIGGNFELTNTGGYQYDFKVNTGNGDSNIGGTTSINGADFYLQGSDKEQSTITFGSNNLGNNALKDNDFVAFEADDSITETKPGIVEIKDYETVNFAGDVQSLNAYKMTVNANEINVLGSVLVQDKITTTEWVDTSAMKFVATDDINVVNGVKAIAGGTFTAETDKNINIGNENNTEGLLISWQKPENAGAGQTGATANISLNADNINVYGKAEINSNYQWPESKDEGASLNATAQNDILFKDGLDASAIDGRSDLKGDAQITLINENKTGSLIFGTSDKVDLSNNIFTSTGNVNTTVDAGNIKMYGNMLLEERSYLHGSADNIQVTGTVNIEDDLSKDSDYKNGVELNISTQSSFNNGVKVDGKNSFFDVATTGNNIIFSNLKENNVVTALHGNNGAQIHLNSGDNGINYISSEMKNETEDDREITIWAQNGAQMDIEGAVNIINSSSNEKSNKNNGVAVSAGGRELNYDEDGTLETVDNLSEININYASNAKDSEEKIISSVIYGDIIAGYGGKINIYQEDESNTRSLNENNSLIIEGNVLSANNGSATISLGKGGYWEGRADDYQDADKENWDETHLDEFAPQFSNGIEASGNVNINLAENSTWDVTGQSWVTKLEGDNSTIILNGDETKGYAVHIGTLSGNNTFVLNLTPEALETSDMIYVQNGTNDKQTLLVANERELVDNKDWNEIRFATVADAVGSVGDSNFDYGGSFGDTYTIKGRGVRNVDYEIKYVAMNKDTTSDDDNKKYNGGESFNEVKPGEDYVQDNYNKIDEGQNSQYIYLVRNENDTPVVNPDEDLTDSGKTVINMSRANYKNAIYMDRLNKRLGEARYINNEEEQGMWVRLRHDRIGQSGDFRSMNTMYELGYDEKQECDNGERRVGFAVDYMRGSTTYSDILGKGETKRYGLWLYDTWMGDKGHYADYVAKWGHLSNDFDIRDKDSFERVTGDYSNNVFSVSAEYGRKKDIGNDWYFEPQAQLQLARVTGAEYTTTTQDTKVSVDGINSLIGRAGFRLGRDVDERSTVYIKADLLHEFLGDQTITATDATGSMRETFENKGTWYDVGFGFATALGKDSYAFLDFEKSFGNDNDETYQINAGVQWTF